MSHETSKTVRAMGPALLEFLKGDGIDIGAGSDPVLPSVRRFDMEHGDANKILSYVEQRFDFVFSAHCLEHMLDPRKSIQDWFSLLKPGGHLVVIVPDEDLYEQGHFPSLFNPDHKWTFTISKARSWSPKSLNVTELVASLNGKLIRLELQDQGYDRRQLFFRASPWRIWLRKFDIEVLNRIPIRRVSWFLKRIVAKFSALDQTALSDDRLAQILFVVRKAAL